MTTRLQRQRRAAIAKLAIAAMLAVLVLTPRLDGITQSGDQDDAQALTALALSSPSTSG